MADYIFPVKEVSNLDIAFPAQVSHLMPMRGQIPQEFYDFPPHDKFSKFFTDWFYRGIAEYKITPKEGIDKDKAMRHLACIIGSYEPKHEDKAAAVAFLCSLWFDDVTWTPNPVSSI